MSQFYVKITQFLAILRHFDVKLRTKKQPPKGLLKAFGGLLFIR